MLTLGFQVICSEISSLQEEKYKETKSSQKVHLSKSKTIIGKTIS
jgi:hypothetical protein